jgi:hypothetical protein
VDDPPHEKNPGDTGSDEKHNGFEVSVLLELP